MSTDRLPRRVKARNCREAASIPGPAYAIDDDTAIKSDRRHRQGRLRGALEALSLLAADANRE